MSRNIKTYMLIIKKEWFFSLLLMKFQSIFTEL